MTPINIGAAPNDGTGDSFRESFRKTNANFAEVSAALANAGVSVEYPRKLSCGVGDSLCGHYRNQWPQSPYQEMFAKHYNANLYVDPAWSFAAPGQRSGYVLDNMVPALAAKIAATGIVPDICDLTTGQNDGVVRLDIAQISYANAIETALQIKALGIKHIIFWGPVPDPKLPGFGRPQALDWLNNALMNWCATQPGIYFLNLLPLVKDRTLEFELAPICEVRWKGGVDAAGNYQRAGGIGGTGIDNEHPSPYFGSLVAPELAKIVRQLCGEMPMADNSPFNYDAAYNPLGNYLGERGSFIGSGGTIDGVASSNVANNWNLAISPAPGGSASITPYLTVDARGNRRQGLAFSGTPANSGLIVFSTNMTTAAPNGDWMLQVRCARKGLRGVPGMSVSGQGMNLGSAGNLYNIMPGELNDDAYLLRNFAPIQFENSYNGRAFNCSSGFVAGVEMSGALEFYNLSMNFIR